MSTTRSTDAPVFEATRDGALRLDAADPLAAMRDRFMIPPSSAHDDGRPSVYLVGNSLGCMPKGVRAVIEQELDDWATLGVRAHLEGRCPWYSYHEQFRGSLARLVGARPSEVVVMNSLTVNLHLMLVSFYKPSGTRTKILIEPTAFPSDSYAVASHARLHGLDPAEVIVRLQPRADERTLRTQDIIAQIESHGDEIALVLMGGVNYLTGQWFDMEAISRAAKARGCMVGWDLAHAAGNVPMRLHDWGVDFAVWCSYKYLNAGPGATAGCFVHDDHADEPGRNRLAGWWGNDPATRFAMVPDFVPATGADGWQLSNPSILAMAPMRVSLSMFDEVGIDALRAKSIRLTGYLEFLLSEMLGDRAQIITPSDPAQRGCQLSILVPRSAREVHAGLTARGIVADFREPDVIRVAPAPMFNSFGDMFEFAEALDTETRSVAGGGHESP